ncbi:sulfatase [Pelobium sp.]|nr:sulfatase [Pelobium sp.]MDA9555459.1 sulfatase [Pelobium sp.]
MFLLSFKVPYKVKNQYIVILSVKFFQSIFLGLIFILTTNTIVTGQTKSKKPNIVFILADDLGWMDITSNGSKYYETPNIDRLAKRGMIFSNAYTANPLCSPTRASILSGQYPARFHFTTPGGHLAPNPDVPLMKDKAVAWNKVITPTSRTFLPLESYTIAEKLKTVGYTTGFIGKWHLGQNPYSPEAQGFDFNVAGGPNPGPPNYFSPYKIKNLPDGPLHEYITDRVTEEALKYIDMKKDTTFFLCMWEFAVHAPFQGKLDYVKYYENKVDPRGKQNNPIMAAMIKSLDESVGRIMDKLDELKLTDNTMIVFYSDNGGNMYDIVNGKDATNNFPLKYGKGNIHEGGVKVPLIVSWPGKIKPNSMSDEVITSVDFYPTLLDVASTKADKGQILDGVSLIPVLTENKSLNREAIFCHFPHYVPATNNYPSTSVRKGDWKLIRVYGEGKNQSDAYELYNLKTDLGEERNLASKMPEKVKELNALIVKHVNEIDGIFPKPNPAFNPNVKSPMGVRPIFPSEKYIMY